ncbi:MAG TPA: hypothetical protein VHB98_18555 [Chloroflexota bacterium]|nr:hypothetical protein [Chloroflexota bacterium]
MDQDTASPNPAAQTAWGVQARHENLWPARAAILGTMALYLTLPDRLTVGPTWLLPVLEAALLAPLTVAAPVRHTREVQLQRLLSIGLIALINLANIGSLVLLLSALLHHGVAFHGRPLDGPTLLQASLQIWLTNILVFALWYWELDRGGPIARRQRRHREPDFLFPQMSTPGCSPGTWFPHFIDYLYVSFTNATAFSPTDTLPLTPWTKLLMLVQAFASLLTVALVAARAVNILQ